MTTTLAFLLGGVFVAGRVRWLMNLFADRVHQQMIDGVEKLRSRTPDGSANSGVLDPQQEPEKKPAGVERLPLLPRPASPLAPAGAGGAATRSAQLPAPAGPHSPRRLVHG